MASIPDPTEPVLIKKYGNRRLYDTRQSQYITLEDLAGIVRSGAQVKVVEASTDRDLTRQVLTQVILEQQEALDLVPVELLHAVIRVRGTLEQAPFAAFLAAMTGQLVSRGNLLAQQLAAFVGSLPGSLPGVFPGLGTRDVGRGAAAQAHAPSAQPAAASREATPPPAASREAAPPPAASRETAPPPAASREATPPPASSPDQGEADLASMRQRMDALLSKLRK